MDKDLPDQEFQDIVDSLRLELDTGAIETDDHPSVPHAAR
jgi:hypothetical protein